MAQWVKHVNLDFSSDQDLLVPENEPHIWGLFGILSLSPPSCLSEPPRLVRVHAHTCSLSK